MPHQIKLATPTSPIARAAVKDAQEEDAPLKSLAQHPGWKRAREKFMQEVDRLESVRSVKGETNEEKVLSMESNLKAAGVLRGIWGEIDQYAESA